MIIQGIDTAQLEKAMQSFDWSTAFYDPLEANTEAETAADQTQFARLEQLIYQLQCMFFTPEGRAVVASLVTRYWSEQPMAQQLPILFALNDALSTRDHCLLPEARAKCQGGLAEGKCWLVFNQVPYFLGADDVHWFRTGAEGALFATGHRDVFTDYALERVTAVSTLERLFRNQPGVSNVPTVGLTEDNAAGPLRRRRIKRKIRF